MRLEEHYMFWNSSTRFQRAAIILLAVSLTVALVLGFLGPIPILTSVCVVLLALYLPVMLLSRRISTAWPSLLLSTIIVLILAIKERARVSSWMVVFLAILSVFCAILAVVEGIRAWRRRRADRLTFSPHEAGSPAPDPPLK